VGDYYQLMRQAWQATGQMRYQDIAHECGLSKASVHRYLSGCTSYHRTRVLQLLLWIYGDSQPALIAKIMRAHDEERQRTIDARRFRMNER
jgi:AcrR family transcriptional regulator